MSFRHNLFFPSVILVLIMVSSIARAQSLKENPALDKKVKSFLDNQRGQWREMNIPEVDGQILFDLIVENNLKSALEIGTSTGHSGIWIAWALSKTGGKLITIDIDERRHKIALNNFKEAGLMEYIDARLGDAHKMVPELSGPFDFVFSDADKDWYKNYFISVNPKLKPGGLYVSHNVYYRDRLRSGIMADYVNYLISLSNYSTTFDDSGNGISISKKNMK
jgi:caffeoyl-CoA O-methyltransferase